MLQNYSKTETYREKGNILLRKFKDLEASLEVKYYEPISRKSVLFSNLRTLWKRYLRKVLLLVKSIPPVAKKRLLKSYLNSE
jgi:hypothetical protein